MEVGGRFRCPACNQVHEWTESTVVLTVGRERLRKGGAVWTASN